MEAINFIKSALESNCYWFIIVLVISICGIAMMAVICNRNNMKSFNKVQSLIETKEFKELMQLISNRTGEIDGLQNKYSRQSEATKSIHEKRMYHQFIKDCKSRKAEIETIATIIKTRF